MKIMKRATATVIGAAMLIGAGGTAAYAALVYEHGNNKAWNSELVQLYYYGRVQAQGSEWWNIDGQQRWTVSGFLRYYNGGHGDTGRLYTASASGRNDGTIRQRDRYYGDTLDPAADSTRFNYGWSTAPLNEVLVAGDDADLREVSFTVPASSELDGVTPAK
ncbi:hypothetical protein [Promicromonospora sp. NFX87]|uniref:hypothetical protein n=1 Tax=Promicromonospora sp. NFX87 TaxID=3402691 RepID=UPI003AFA867B